MKWFTDNPIFYVALMVATALALAAIGDLINAKLTPTHITPKAFLAPEIWTDPKYHCEYVVTPQGGIYPRLGAECADQNEEKE